MKETKAYLVTTFPTASLSVIPMGMGHNPNKIVDNNRTILFSVRSMTF